jgi:outer membrane protein OmpA-like peptidoglycan-associated protein
MLLKHTIHTELFTAVLIFCPFSLVLAQTPPTNATPSAKTAPIYNVTVVGRTVDAVNYQYRSGPTQIDFRGTVLLPQGKGDAVVESKAGRTDVDARFEHLAPVQQFGREYLTYVLWAITPEGQAKNLGEVLANGSDKAHTHVTTDLQKFGLIVTAEPYSAVHVPSDVVVLENQIRPDTIGATEPIRVHVELMPRGTYTYNVPSEPPVAGRSVSMSEYEELLELYQAQNALQIAEAQGAAKYAPEVLEKARSEYENARQLQSRKHADKDVVVTAARGATQRAEDARALTVSRKHDAELADARSKAEREQQLRLQAEAQVRSAQAEAADAQAKAVAASNALVSERNARSTEEKAAVQQATEQQSAALSTPPPPPPQPVTAPPAAAYVTPPAGQNEPDDSRVALRVQLLAQLKGSFDALDTERGLVVTLPDQDFHGVALQSSFAESLRKLVAIVKSRPGLEVEVDGNSDTGGSAGEQFSLDRATEVEDALIRDGLAENLIQARGLGDARPFGPNTTEQGKQDNRRVEIIIHGDPIGNRASWNKPYSVNLGR